MFKTIIIEDEPNSALLLEQMLQEIEPAVKIVEKCIDLPSGIKSIKKYNPDLVFLDIELPVYNGIQLLDFFNPEEITFNIIFTTAFNEYAVRAFEMSAVDYLLKPLHEEKLRGAMEKFIRNKSTPQPEVFPLLRQNFQNQGSKKIVVPVANGFEVLNLKDVCYFKAEGSYTQIFFTDNTSLLVSKNLKHFEFILSEIQNFVRIHRSFMVNINFVKKISKKDGGLVFLENHAELPIAEDKTQKILELLTKM
jgi:two-component system LytT family response regulator